METNVMDTKEIVKSQYHAALDMMHQTIDRCPDALGVATTAKNQFWHVAYHTLFYTHLYLQPAEEEFVPWVKHKAESEFLGPLPWPPHREPNRAEPYTREEALEYLAYCREQVDLQVTRLDLAGPSGFDWLPFSKLELQLYTIRHLQHHCGELADRQGIEVDWVGVGRGDPHTP